jgi:hypothetical protein
MHAKLKRTSKSMQSKHGPTKAAMVIDKVMRRKIA